MKKRLIIYHLVGMIALLVFGSGLFGESGAVHAGDEGIERVRP
jgi:hypothetical protein